MSDDNQQLATNFKAFAEQYSLIQLFHHSATLELIRQISCLIFSDNNYYSPSLNIKLSTFRSTEHGLF